jgi:hypothetical protein
MIIIKNGNIISHKDMCILGCKNLYKLHNLMVLLSLRIN